jgi:hypothetical protein
MVSIHSYLAEGRLTKILRALRRCLWISLCLMAAVSRAAGPDDQFDKWFAVQTNLQSWSADFIQTRSLKVLAQPLVSAGKVWVKPGEFRWELGQPVQTIVLRRPDQLLIVYPRLKRAERYSLDGVPSGPMKDALALLDASLPRCPPRRQIQFCKCCSSPAAIPPANSSLKL